MENFRRNNRFSGRSGGGGSRFGGRSSERAEMHKAICSKCGKECEVPFKPRGDKPVFCSDCFRNEGNNNAEPRRFGGRDSGRSSFSDKKMYEAVCDKCGKDCEVPFRPTGDKPIYCSECFSKSGNDKKSSGQSNNQFGEINTKLDKILKLLSPVTSEKAIQKREIVKKEVVVKSKKKVESNPKVVVKAEKKVVTKPNATVKSRKKVEVKPKRIVIAKKVKAKKKK